MPDIFISRERDPLISPDEKIHEGTPSSLPPEEPKTEPQRMKVPGHTHSRLSSMRLYPEDVNFETKEKEEQIVLLLRQHPIVNVKWILITVLWILFPSLAQAFGVFGGLPVGFGLVITLAWYLVAMAYALENFLNWYFNVYFVTTQRIIDVDFYNLIDKKVSSAELDMIQDDSYTSYGIWRILFNYGDVFIQTAAEVSEFDFLAVPNPERVIKIIDELRDKVKEK